MNAVRSPRENEVVEAGPSRNSPTVVKENSEPANPDSLVILLARTQGHDTRRNDPPVSDLGVNHQRQVSGLSVCDVNQAGRSARSVRWNKLPERENPEIVSIRSDISVYISISSYALHPMGTVPDPVARRKLGWFESSCRSKWCPDSAEMVVLAASTRQIRGCSSDGP